MRENRLYSSEGGARSNPSFLPLSSAAEAVVKINFVFPDADVSFQATVDPLALQQAVLNLLDNAIKHSPPNSEISLTMRRTSDRFEIAVTDSGPGIPATEHRRIFDRFYRLGSELRRETAGVGIGLSIVQHIVEGHRGDIQVESEPGHGARFTISLPLS
jgi:signal transduction histidine kinase